MSTLGQLVDTVGRAVADVVIAPQGLDVEIADVLVHDPADPPEIGRGDLVLGIGLTDVNGVVGLIDGCAQRRAAALAVKSFLISHHDIDELIGQHDIAIIGIHGGTSWAQLIALLHAALTHGRFGAADETVLGVQAGDLFALADTVASLVDAPVTIEDRLSRVLAYSGRQEEADPARTETIVGRKVPERFVKRFEKEGVFDRLSRSDSSIYLENIEAGVLPRLVVPVKAGQEFLGSMWAACQSKPTAVQVSAFEDSARVAALHLLRQRAGADLERRIEADLLGVVLEGNTGTTDALGRLGLEGDSYQVIAIAGNPTSGVVDDASPIVLRDLLIAELRTARIRAATTLLAGVVYAVVALRQVTHLPITEFAEGFAEACAGRTGVTPHVALGGATTRPREISRSRKEADATLRVLRAKRLSGPVASIENARLHALLLRLGEVLAGEKEVYEAKLQKLMQIDSATNVGYIETLTAFVQTFGDIREASKQLSIHPNTLRYRLQKMQKLADIDLKDRSELLSLAILLSAASEQAID